MLAGWPVLAVTFYNFFTPGNFWSSFWLLRFYCVSNHVYGQDVHAVCGGSQRQTPRVLRESVSLFWFMTLWCGFVPPSVFCMQESAKAALNMKDCQMTDRATQTEHTGPEVRHRENTDSFLTLSENTKGHCARVLSERKSDYLTLRSSGIIKLLFKASFYPSFFFNSLFEHIIDSTTAANSRFSPF